MLQPAISLFFLRGLPFSHFRFSRWWSFLAITLLGFLVGLDPSMRIIGPGLPRLALWPALVTGVLSTWTAFGVFMLVLRWWLKRGSRWDGHGDLFNLMAASWLMADALGASAIAFGIVPSLFVAPLWLYSLWVGANAFAGAIPKAAPGYSLAGILIGFIPALLASGVVMFGMGLLVAKLGFVLPFPAPTPAGG